MTREERNDVVNSQALLMDALLPAGLPVLPEVDLAGLYLMAGAGSPLGGVWFDAIPLPDGRTALVVGEVVGHGVRALVVMGQLKTILEERLRIDGDLVAALEALDLRARWMPEARAATVCVLIIDATAGEVVYCTAGHPPPLIVRADGQAEYLPTTGAGPLASGHPYEVHRVPLHSEDLVLLYSNGLVERSERSAGRNAQDLLGAAGDPTRAARPSVAHAERAVEHLCRRTVDLLTRTGFDEDIIVFAAQRKRPAEPLELTLPAAFASIRRMREAVREWVNGLGISVVDDMALRHAVGELVGNAVEHAYVDCETPVDATVRLHMCLTQAGFVEAQVVDQGRWRPPTQANGRGRGLAMTQGFADEFEIRHDASGTTGTLRLRVLRPIPLFTSSTAVGASIAPRDAVDCAHADGVLVVTGAIDQKASDEVRRRLSHANHGGASDVIVDLTGVTHLASAGVQLLYEAISPWAGARSHVQLVAAPGSAVQHVLDRVQLPYSFGLEVRLLCL